MSMCKMDSMVIGRLGENGTGRRRHGGLIGFTQRLYRGGVLCQGTRESMGRGIFIVNVETSLFADWNNGGVVWSCAFTILVWSIYQRKFIEISQC